MRVLCRCCAALLATGPGSHSSVASPLIDPLGPSSVTARRDGNCATELKPTTKKVDFFPRAIDCKASLPFYQAWSRAYKKVGPLQSIASNQEKSAAQGAKKGPFCMGILVTLSLSKRKAPNLITVVWLKQP